MDRAKGLPHGGLQDSRRRLYAATSRPRPCYAKPNLARVKRWLRWVSRIRLTS